MGRSSVRAVEPTWPPRAMDEGISPGVLIFPQSVIKSGWKIMACLELYDTLAGVLTFSFRSTSYQNEMKREMKARKGGKKLNQS
mmetsp:Transcript_33583/g.69881  ORF Transcript_33583/g.69881 Transcript_33583/m.69881 type:complete len:84 (-) Transcript_33583:160-411(-)